jgi:hypothetical protein
MTWERQEQCSTSKLLFKLLKIKGTCEQLINNKHLGTKLFVLIEHEKHMTHIFCLVQSYKGKEGCPLLWILYSNGYIRLCLQG